MKLDAGPLLLVGCGKMGGALLSGWLARGLKPGDVQVVEPAPVSAPPGVAVVAAIDGLPGGFTPELVVLAVKPQSMAEVLPAYRRFAPRAGFLSIAAGRTIRSYAAVLGPQAAIIRAMPNTPAAIGRGMTVLCANERTGAAQRDLAGALMAAVGETAWIDDEALMDAVTAVSGSGPAYVFLLIEALAAAGTAQGLAPELALQLARATVAGAGELASRAGEPPAVLRQNVTSPGGTTAAALAVLMAEDGLAGLMLRAVAAATRRGRELAAS